MYAAEKRVQHPPDGALTPQKVILLKLSIRNAKMSTITLNGIDERGSPYLRPFLV
jgi:hypothetical protein